MQTEKKCKESVQQGSYPAQEFHKESTVKNSGERIVETQKSLKIERLALPIMKRLITKGPMQ